MDCAEQTIKIVKFKRGSSSESIVFVIVESAYCLCVKKGVILWGACGDFCLMVATEKGQVTIIIMNHPPRLNKWRTMNGMEICKSFHVQKQRSCFVISVLTAM